MFEAEFWVAVAFVIFVGVLIYFRVHTLAIDAIDGRRARIETELGEARRLREEAQALLAQYQHKQREAEAEAADIIAGARSEERRVGKEGEHDLGREALNHKDADD